MIRAFEDFGWLFYVQSTQLKAINITELLISVTFQNASEPRCPPMTYQEIKDYIESVLDANHIPSITPQIGMLLNNGDKSLFYDEAEGQPGYDDSGASGGVRGRGRGTRGDRGGGQGAGQGRGGGQVRGGRTDRAGRFPNDLSRMKTASGAPICVNFQKDRCEKEVVNGSCGTGNSARKHICAVIVETKPFQLCESKEHGACNCELKL